MEKLIKSKLDTFNSICYIIKALALFFCFYPLFDVFFQYSAKNPVSQMSIRSMIISFLLLLMVLGIWLILQPSQHVKPWRKYLEIAVFYGICFASILASGGYESEYKFLFIFMVVTYTIQYGMKYGLMITFAASVTLLGMDLYVFASKHTNASLQSDFALIIMFGIISYILGCYVRMETEHINELTHLANYDGLTNLYNHRYFHEAMERQWKRVREHGGIVAIVMMDIDYFKMFNDIRGHQEGDHVLALIAGLIRNSVREQDICCRYGGEEFAVILPGAGEEEAYQVAERIRVAVMDEKIEGEEYLPSHHLTISLGVAVYDPNDATYSEMLARADSALYRAKYLRKNCVQKYQNVFDRFSNLDEKTKDALLSIRGLVGIINIRDDYTYCHTERVAFCCGLMCKYMNLSQDDSRTLLISAYMHDIGKINIPREVLISNRPLTDDEWQMIKNHPTAGKTILSQISGMDTVGMIVGQHHERYDGKGYPDGISGEEIHPLASLLSLADSFDAMTNDRPYQKHRGFHEALEEIRKCKGKQFSPQYADLFIGAIEEEIAQDGTELMHNQA